MVRRKEKTTFTSTMLTFTSMVILTEEKLLTAVGVRDTVRVPEKVGGKWTLQEFQSEGSEGKVKIRKASYFHSVKIRKPSHHTASSVHSVRV